MSKSPEKQMKIMVGQIADLTKVVGKQGKQINKLNKRLNVVEPALEKASETVEKLETTFGEALKVGEDADNANNKNDNEEGA